MAKASTDTPRFDAIAALPGFDIEPLIAANQRGLKAAAEAQEHMLRRIAKMHEELFRFADRRLQHDRSTARELAACKSPQDAAAVCGKFFESAMKQYSEEVTLLAGLYADQARETMEDVQHQVEETVEPVLKRKNGA
ncbi:MAG: phasin family protein [Pseudomonadota bacterium]